MSGYINVGRVPRANEMPMESGAWYAPYLFCFLSLAFLASLAVLTDFFRMNVQSLISGLRCTAA